MSKSSQAIAGIAVACSLAATGCENMTAGENAAILGGLAGAATGIALGTTGVGVGTALPVSLGAAAAGGALGYGASKMQTNRDQRLFAEQRGQMLVSQAQQRGTKNIPRYILVDTIAEKPTQGRPVMVFDTATGKVASRRLYYVSMAAGPDGFVEAPASMVGAPPR